MIVQPGRQGGYLPGGPGFSRLSSASEWYHVASLQASGGRMFPAQKGPIWVGPAILLLFLGTIAGRPASAQGPKRITILYDALGPNAGALEMDWGFSALIEYGGKRILFDTGNNAQVFARNSKKLQVDLAHLDAAVISHRHGDHTSGLNHLLQVNPGVKIYVPVEGACIKSPITLGVLIGHPALPANVQHSP